MKITGAIEFSIIERTADRVVAEMPIEPGIKNPYGSVQAGAILWFADVAASVLLIGSAQPSEGMQGFPLAINLNANFLANQREGAFKAISAILKRGRSVSVVRTMVYGTDEKLIADVTTNHVLAK